MRIANLAGRAVLVVSDGAGVDVATASAGRFGPDVGGLYERWDEFTDWAAEYTASPTRSPTGSVEIDRGQLGPPSPRPGQIIAIGLNYRGHAAEAGKPVPEIMPPVFTKFRSCLTGPDTVVVLPPGGQTDWEIELVVVIGRAAARVAEADAWSFVAGLTIAQDISERRSQLAAVEPQLDFSKSHPGFGPMGPWLVTPDEFGNPDDLELGCAIDGEIVQRGRTSDLVFPVGRLIATLSERLTLQPGDVILTGTPAGVGMGRTPQRFLREGEVLRSWIEGIGELHQTFIAH